MIIYVHKLNALGKSGSTTFASIVKYVFLFLRAIYEKA